MRGASLHPVQGILRHSDPRTTAGTYLHLEPGYLRREIDLLSFAPTDSPPAASVPNTRTASPEAAPFAAILLLGPGGGGEGGSESPHRFHLKFQILAMERDIGFEPTTFSLGKQKRPFRAVTGSAK